MPTRREGHCVIGGQLNSSEGIDFVRPAGGEWGYGTGGLDGAN